MNHQPSRRRFLAAVPAVALTAGAAIATEIAVDPALAAVTAWKAAKARSDAATERFEAVWNDHGAQEFSEAERAYDAARDACLDAEDRVLLTPPTTPAGGLAVLAFLVELGDGEFRDGGIIPYAVDAMRAAHAALQGARLS